MAVRGRHGNATERFALVLGLLLVATGSGCASWGPDGVPAGYVLMAGYEPSPARQEPVTDTTGAHTRSIRFHFELADAPRYWWIAEAVAPRQDPLSGGPAKGQPGDEAARWWDRTFDGVRLPVALTGTAVDYFFDLQDDIRAGRVRTSVPVLSTHLEYSVRVFLSTSGVVHVDTDLEWAMACGDECALLLQKERSVALQRDGSVLSVEGDGSGLVEVASAARPRACQHVPARRHCFNGSPPRETHRVRPRSPARRS